MMTSHSVLVTLFSMCFLSLLLPPLSAAECKVSLLQPKEADIQVERNARRQVGRKRKKNEGLTYMMVVVSSRSG